MASLGDRILFVVGMMAVLAGCGSPSATPTSHLHDAGTGVKVDAGPPPLGEAGTLGGPTLQSITVAPAQASIELLNGVLVTQAFTATGVFADGSMQALSQAVSWSVDSSPVGAIDGSGLYTPTDTVGGLVNVTATYNGQTGTAQLTVKLHLTANPSMVPAASQMALTTATTADTSVVWAYPYDGTVFPRGLGAPPLMWNGSTAGDLYYVHLTSPTFEYEAFGSADPPSQYAFPQSIWDTFAGSTSGASTLSVARLSAAGAATTIAHLGWTIAPASLRGTVYYWANNKGRVERIQPGATAPDDFADQPPLTDTTMFPKQSSCLMTCHTVSANGSVLVSGGGTFGGSYDLKTDLPMNSLGGVWGYGLPDGTTEDDWQVAQWETPAISPDGQYVATNQLAMQLSLNLGGPGTGEGLYKTADGSLVPNSGMDTLMPLMPAWSPDGKSIAYQAGVLTPMMSWDGPPAGPLSVVAFDPNASPMASNPTVLVQPGSDPNLALIAWPSISPDGRWVVYQRGTSADTRNGNADLYLADAQNPGAEARLAALDGDGYPFAAGMRDLSLNYEPTFAPVASGGYFWVVFTSRRTYGNLLTGDKTMVKQLWIAAINQTSPNSENPANPMMIPDPSHPPFLLTAQDNTSLNMRGYFALPPCKSDGVSCGQGTDCCGGYCNQVAGDAGAGPDGGPSALVCASMANGCSQNGDHCTQSSDCCSAASGVTCINSVCSEPPPQ